MNTLPLSCALVLSVSFAFRMVAAEPAELTKAKGIYQEASERALAPVKVAYAKELTRLIEEYTRTGKLEEALIVKNELTRLTGDTATPLPASAKVNTAAIVQLRERFVGRTFVTPGGTQFVFNKDGSGQQTWKEGSGSFQWETFDEKTIRVKVEGKQYFFWFESRLKGEMADALNAPKRPVKAKS